MCNTFKSFNNKLKVVTPATQVSQNNISRWNLKKTKTIILHQLLAKFYILKQPQMHIGVVNILFLQYQHTLHNISQRL